MMPSRWARRLEAAAWRWKERRRFRRYRIGDPDDPFDAELRLVLAIDWPLETALDIGANNGRYAFRLLRGGVSPDRLHLFEPLPDLHDRLRDRLCDPLPEACIHPIALSDRSGAASVTVPRIRGRRCASRASLETYRERGQTGAETVQVRTEPLDRVVENLRTDRRLDRIGFIKIDVEGHEWTVVRGGQRVLEAHRPLLLVEIEQRHHEESIDAIFDWLHQRGFEGYFLDPGSLRLRSVEQFDLERHQRLEDLEQRRLTRYVNNFLFEGPRRFSMRVPGCCPDSSPAANRGRFGRLASCFCRSKKEPAPLDGAGCKGAPSAPFGQVQLAGKSRLKITVEPSRTSIS